MRHLLSTLVGAQVQVGRGLLASPILKIGSLPGEQLVGFLTHLDLHQSANRAIFESQFCFKNKKENKNMYFT